METGERKSYADQPGYPSIDEGVKSLEGAEVIGHNWLTYDGPVLRKLKGHLYKPGKETDTLVWCRLCLPDTTEWDDKLIYTARVMDTKLRKSHSLKAWGIRLGFAKSSFDDNNEDKWLTWTQEMQTYCEQDVLVNVKVYEWCVQQGFNQKAIDLEHATAPICFAMELNGYPLDIEYAENLYQNLMVQKAENQEDIQKFLGKNWMRSEGGDRKFKSDGRRFILNEHGSTTRRVKKKGQEAYFETGYWEYHSAGGVYSPIEYGYVKPTRAKVAHILVHRFGWVPLDYTADGKPSMKEIDISSLPISEDLRLALIQMYKIEKISSMLLGKVRKDGGGNGWLQVVQEDGCIRGRINPNGTPTGRASHFAPNIAQIPSTKVDKEDNTVWGYDGGYGAECRRCFITKPGWQLVGSDLSGLELRMLGNFLYPYDDGQYIDTVLNGDIHTYNQKAAGLSSRKIAKTFIYAWLYGAGDFLIGTFDPPPAERVDGLYVACDQGYKARISKWFVEEYGRKPTKQELAVAKQGSLIKARFFKGMPALAALKEDVILASRGYRRSGRDPTPSEESKGRHINKRQYDKRKSEWIINQVWKPTWVLSKRSQRWWRDTSDGGFIYGLDGRKMWTRSEHSALNYLLQGGGALVCKRWLIETDKALKSYGLTEGWG